MNWDPIVQPPKDGERVDQSITGRALATLQRRTDFLYQRLSDFSAQNGKLVIQNAELDPSVGVGDWVYFDSSSSTYKQAIAEGVYDTNLKQYTATARTFVVGVCVSASANLGSILMGGWIESLATLGVNPSLMVEGGQSYVPGQRYYLSRKQAGKMTSFGGAPLVQLGFFSDDTAFVSPLQKDIFESHTHYRFDLAAKPSASQNTDGTGGTTISAKRYVDYFYSPASHTPPNVLVSIKNNGTTPSSIYGSTHRVEIYRDGAGLMGVDVFGGSLDISDPTSGTSVTSVTGLTWPAYGEWYAVPNTGLSVAFFRQDATYTTNTLHSDITDGTHGITPISDRFKFYLPNDLTGWTNVNPFDGQYTHNTLYRYIRESDTALNSVWPPVPTSSVSITNNGVILNPGEDFFCAPQDLLWIPGTIDGSTSLLYAPWPYDYSARTAEDPASQFFKSLQLFFSKSDISTAKPLVTSLQSSNPALIVTDCLTGAPANAGNLAIDLRLDLNTAAGPDADSAISSVDPVTGKFFTTSIVNRISAGSGVKIAGTTTNVQGQQNGDITISVDSVQSSGEVSVVSLRNAKESLYNGITPCILFLPPATAKCQVVSKIKIPSTGLGASPTISINIGSSVFGAAAVGSTTQVVTFKAVHYVLRNGVNLNNFVEANAFGVQYWALHLVNYTPYTVLADQYPNDSAIVTSGTTPSNFSVLTTGNIDGTVGNLAPGDCILTVIERVAQIIDGQTDNYTGNVGLTGINWSLSTT